MDSLPPTREEYARFIGENWEQLIDAAEEQWRQFISWARVNGKQPAMYKFCKCGHEYGVFDPHSVNVRSEIFDEGLDFINYTALGIRRSADEQ